MTEKAAINAGELKVLRDSGADGFDPVRFCYIESMAQRIPGQSGPVARLLEQKIQKALHDYRADLTLAREEAATIVAGIATQFPNSAQSAHRLFEGCEFKAVKRLETRLRRHTNKGALAALTNSLIHGEPTSDGQVKSLSFDDILRRQEEALVNALASPGHEQPGELKSMWRLRESLVKISADKLITQAMADLPEEAGPLNPQMLVVRSLATMRDLSPQYLNRFVSYMDTLLWLERADQ